MACHAAMNSSVVSVRGDTLVEDVIALMGKKNTQYVAVVNDEKILQGFFSYRTLFKNVLPVSVSPGSHNAAMVIKAAPGVAKRLKKLEPIAIERLMERRVNVVYPDTQTWEGLGLYVEYGEPIFVVEKETGKLLGEMTGDAAYNELERLKESET